MLEINAAQVPCRVTMMLVHDCFLKEKVLVRIVLFAPIPAVASLDIHAVCMIAYTESVYVTIVTPQPVWPPHEH